MSKISISSKFVLLLLFFLFLVGTAYFFILQNVYHEQLLLQARTVADNVEAFGSWVAKYGRVWVKDDDSSYLGKLEVTSTGSPPSSVHFYSKNPALAQREFSEVVDASTSSTKFRMTSHNYMNPLNRPDDFEVDALLVVRSNKVDEYESITDNQYRYARAIYHKASCITCHGDPDLAPADVLNIYGSRNGFGFEEGDVAGIISVKIPRESLFRNALKLIGPVEIGLVVLAFAASLWLVRRNIIRPIKQLTQAAELISVGKGTDLGTQTLDANSRNEIHKLTFAIARLRASMHLVMRRLSAKNSLQEHPDKDSRA